VAADPERPLRTRNPEPLAGRHPQDAEAPACGAVLAGTDLPGRKRCALIADADQNRGRDGAGVAVLVPAGGQEAATAEVRDLASAGQGNLAPGEGMDPGEVEVSILARAEVKRGRGPASRFGRRGRLGQGRGQGLGRGLESRFGGRRGFGPGAGQDRCPDFGRGRGPGQDGPGRGQGPGGGPGSRFGGPDPGFGRGRRPEVDVPGETKPESEVPPKETPSVEESGETKENATEQESLSE